MATQREKFILGLQQQKAEEPGLASRREKWIGQLQELIAKIRGWLNEAESKGLITLYTDEAQVIEQRLGAYRAPCLVIRFPNGRFIRIEPRGLEVFGANGRVDVLSGPSRAMLIQGEPGKWEIVEKEPGSIKRVELTESALFDLLSRLTA